MGNTASFPIAPCPACDRHVLLEAAILEGDLIHICFHCGAPTDRETIEWVSEDAINRSGYITEGWQDPHGERGCRGGACGVQQPDA